MHTILLYHAPVTELRLRVFYPHPSASAELLFICTQSEGHQVYLLLRLSLEIWIIVVRTAITTTRPTGVVGIRCAWVCSGQASGGYAAVEARNVADRESVVGRADDRAEDR